MELGQCFIIYQNSLKRKLENIYVYPWEWSWKIGFTHFFIQTFNGAWYMHYIYTPSHLIQNVKHKIYIHHHHGGLRPHDASTITLGSSVSGTTLCISHNGYLSWDYHFRKWLKSSYYNSKLGWWDELTLNWISSVQSFIHSVYSTVISFGLVIYCRRHCSCVLITGLNLS